MNVLNGAVVPSQLSQMLSTGRRVAVASKHPTVYLAICLAAIPDYRAPFIDEIVRRMGQRVAVFVGDDHFEPDIRVDQTQDGGRIRVSNHYFFGRRILIPDRSRV